VASCAQVERLIQAYVDGELTQSDRVIFEQHVVQCPTCEVLLHKHRQMCADLFETFSEERLQHSLVPQIIEHLPEMEQERADVQTINLRAKHITSRWTRMARLVPAAVLVVLLILAVTIVSQWPETWGNGSDVIGVVTHCAGAVRSSMYASESREAVTVRAFVKCGERFETGPDSALMLTLAGPTQLKVNSDTRVKLCNDRRVSVESGEIWCDVGRDGRLFRVNTPTGDITVFGTAFEVSVRDGKTVVTVEQGRVQVENELAFREVEPGEQVDLVIGQSALVAREVDVATEVAWANKITPDVAAKAFFEREILTRGSTELPAEQVFVVITNRDDRPRSVKSIYLEWAPDDHPANHTGYDIYVSDDYMRPLFKEHISGRTFANKRTSAYEVATPDKPISGVNVLHIKIVPDFRGGEIQTSFTKVSALGI